MAFAITPAAAEEIQARVNFLGVMDAVVTLNDSAPAPAALMDAISAAADNEERLAIGQKEYARLEEQLDFRIGVGIYSRDDCRPEDLVMLAGIRFALPREMLEFLSPCILDHENGNFLLLAGERSFASLREFERSNRNAA